jgi:hypothetical protein
VSYKSAFEQFVAPTVDSDRTPTHSNRRRQFLPVRLDRPVERSHRQIMPRIALGRAHRKGEVCATLRRSVVAKAC